MSHLQVTYEGAVARITLTQPEVRNAFSDEVIAEITTAFIAVGAQDNVRAVVLGADGTAFCAREGLMTLPTSPKNPAGILKF